MNKLLKAKRVINELNQTSIANELGISTYSYLKKENERQDFTQSEIKKLIQFFNLTPEEIVEIFFN